MNCLQDEDDLGEIKHCALADQLCMKGEMGKNLLIPLQLSPTSFKHSISWFLMSQTSKILYYFWIEFEGNTVDVRRCQLAKGKAGQCEEIHIMDMKTEVCYCDTDGCNGSSNILPQSFTILLVTGGVLMMLGMK